MAPVTLNQKTTSTKITTTTATKTVTETKASRKLFTHPVKLLGRQTTPERNVTLEPMRKIDRLPARKTGSTES